MTLLAKLRLHLAVLHAAAIGCAVWAWRNEPLWLAAAEVGAVVSFVVAWRWLSKMTVPFDLVRTGSDLIEEGDFSTTFAPVGQKELDRLLDVYNRIVERLRAERLRVREQNELLDALINASPGGLVLCDFDGRAETLNPAARAWLGSEAIGRALVDLPSPFGRALRELPPGRSKVVSLADGRRVSCRCAEFRDRGFRRHFYLLEEMTDELRRSEKAAYGKIVRLVSHEVNNTVVAVGSLLASLDSIGEGLARSEDREDLDFALDVAGRRLETLRAFVDGFAELVRLPEPRRDRCDLRTTVQRLVRLFTPAATDRGIELRPAFDADGETVIEADAAQLEQALLNLLKNGVEAARSTVTVRLRSGAPDGLIRLDIEDDGPGLSEEAESLIFTPFFTTKADGCGLGLTLVKEILDRHGFGFSLETLRQDDAARGARFSIRF